MYAHINGIICEKTQDSIVLEAGGVGYLLSVSSATLAAAGAAGERMKLYCCLNVREDAMELFGFYSREEKAMYERLRTVSGIGSRTALQILSALSVRELSVALVTGDVSALTRVPGIGKKIAQRLVLELRDKIGNDELTGEASAVAAVPKPAANTAEAEATAALVSLGYTAAEAAKAVALAAKETSETDKMIFLALKYMGS